VLAVGMLIGIRPEPADGRAYHLDLSGPDRLLTNEYAHFNPVDDRAVRSPDWDVTSGSLFVRDGAGWTGRPDAANPNAHSTNGTGSSVFRGTTRRNDFLNTLVSLRVKNHGLTEQGRMAPAETDGVHLFLRWHSPKDLYVVSLNRRDGQITIKRKSPGGEVNGGTYTTLGQVPYQVPYGRWQTFQIWIKNAGDHTVTIGVGNGERTLLKVSDSGATAPADLTAGAVGLRGDNCDFQFDKFLVVPLPEVSLAQPYR
jgi:hypothetical protein